MRKQFISACASVALLAGMPAGLVWAQNQNPNQNPPARNQQPDTNRQNNNDADRDRDRNRDMDRGRDGARATTPMVNFETFDEYTGKDVHNAAGEKVASVEDLIVDRGTGEIMHVVIKTGGVLGMGGKSVALPYSAFGWDPVERKVSLNYTADQLKGMSEFKADAWSELLSDDNNNAARYDTAYKQLRDDRETWSNDPYAETARNKETKTSNITGTVQSVHRSATSTGRDSYIVVNTKDRGPVKVLLGPSWYSVGSNGFPDRGDEVTVRAFEAPRSGETMYVASSVKGPRGDLNLRRDDGYGRWNSSAPALSTDTGSYMPFRYVLLSEVVGKDCDARSEECGEVQKAIIECHSGQVAFLAIDPNENFLGIGDDLHLVPWSVARIYGDVVVLDASRQMIVSSTKLPDDLRTLETASTWNNSYRTFDVDLPTFERYDDAHRDGMHRDDMNRDRDMDRDRNRDATNPNNNNNNNVDPRNPARNPR